MKKNTQLIEKKSCPVCHQLKNPIEMISGSSIRESLVNFIHADNKAWTMNESICIDCLNKARREMVQDHLVKKEEDQLRGFESSLSEIATDVDEPLTFGQIVSDKLAEIGGSWKFIISFIIIIVIWIGINSFVFISKPFDPYPFILLNLVLSCLASLQAPVIMMSQNRKEIKDRKRAEEDYKTNLKAELEIRHLHLKLDHLITKQWQHLLEIQQVQLDTFQEYTQMNKK